MRRDAISRFVWLWVGGAMACSASTGADFSRRGAAAGAGGVAAAGAPSVGGGGGGTSGDAGSPSFGAIGNATGGNASGGTASAGAAGVGAAGASSACDPPNDQPSDEVCDGLDNDLDGFVDERSCACSAGETQPCFDGPPSQAGAPGCHMGTQTCVLAREFGEWGACEGSGCDEVTTTEVCDNGVDDDCDGIVDEGCYLDAEVNLDGDCLSAFCPAQAPNPVGCDITMEGDDPRGCVSHLAGSPEVYFQEGNACPTCLPVIGCTGGAGRVSGTLRCSSSPDATPLDATNCIINKPEPLYTSPSLTPITQPVSGCAQ